MPQNTTDAAHSVAHITSMTVDSVLVGWIYVDRNGSTWFQLAPQTSSKQAHAAARFFGTTLSGEPFGAAAVAVTKPVRPWLLGAHILLHSCF